MSRIQEILNKAEREGTLRRTRGVGGGDGVAVAAPPVPLPLRPEAEPVERHRVTEDEGADAQPVDAPSGDARLDGHLVAALAPHSLAAEQYRSMRPRIAAAERGRTVRTIVVTSPAKGDGKSITAANLALTMAQEFQQRVLLFDADLRQPTIHRLFGISQAPGVTDLLMGGVALEDALVNIPDHHLMVLPAGATSSYPAELLGSASMRRLLDTVRTRFDRIVLDMPPIAPLADVHIALPNVDGLLMIIRAGITPKPAIERALAGIDHGKVLGLVLNEAGEDPAQRYDGYGYIGA
jgi:capsular exopolysaccharide synthesis family protein